MKRTVIINIMTEFLYIFDKLRVKRKVKLKPNNTKSRIIKFIFLYKRWYIIRQVLLVIQSVGSKKFTL